MKLLNVLLGAPLVPAAISDSPPPATNATNLGNSDRIPFPLTYPPSHICIDSIDHTYHTTYDDYWHSHDVFCRHVVDKQVSFMKDQIYTSSDSLCSADRCIFISLQYMCGDVEKSDTVTTIDWDSCMNCFLYPYWGGWLSEPKEGRGVCAEHALKGASVMSPNGCWNFSSEVWSVIDS